MPDSPVPVPSPAAGPRTLLGRLRSALRARHYSPRTEQAYVAWVRRYVEFHDRRHPATMGATEVQAFLTHLAERRRGRAAPPEQGTAPFVVLLGGGVGGAPTAWPGGYCPGHAGPLLPARA